MTNTAIVTKQNFDQVISLVTDSLTSENSRVMYRKALVDFISWREQQGRPDLNKALVQKYKTVLQERNYSAATINQRLSAIRKLASEAADNGVLDPTIAAGIGRASGVKASGVRTGNWLTLAQAQTLLNTPDVSTLKGLRDRAILAVMIGAGLRRSEVAALTFAHIQQRDARWAIVDINGKGGRVRTVPIPSWTKAAVDAWALAADVNSDFIFRRINRGGRISGDSMTSQAIADVAKSCAVVCGYELAAHDLRRSFAKLAHRGGAALEQIQLSLGHASLKTTERYLGVAQSFDDAAPCDHLGLRLEML